MLFKFLKQIFNLPILSHLSFGLRADGNSSSLKRGGCIADGGVAKGAFSRESS